MAQARDTRLRWWPPHGEPIAVVGIALRWWDHLHGSTPSIPPKPSNPAQASETWCNVAYCYQRLRKKEIQGKQTVVRAPLPPATRPVPHLLACQLLGPAGMRGTQTRVHHPPPPRTVVLMPPSAPRLSWRRGSRAQGQLFWCAPARPSSRHLPSWWRSGTPSARAPAYWGGYTPVP